MFDMLFTVDTEKMTFLG